MKKIAVYVNQYGITSTIAEAGFVSIYTKENNNWSITDTFPISVDFTLGIAKVRQEIAEIIKKLIDCKIFVATEVSGQLYYILEANGFNSYEATGEPEHFLNSIIENETIVSPSTSNHIQEEITSITPELTEFCGVYLINLKKALALNPTLSSKKILKPFLQERNYEVLEVLCDHIPRWFDTDFKVMGLTSTTLKLSEKEYKISIMVNK